MEQGHRVALVTVAKTWGSAPRPAGSWLVVRSDGLIEGSVSGGCVEDDLIHRMTSGEMQTEWPFPLVYGVTRDQAERFGLPCGGTLELLVEPAPAQSILEELASRLGSRERVLRSIDIHSGQVALSGASREAALSWSGSRLETVHGPQWRLLIIGAGQTSTYLAAMAQALDYEVSVCDPRQEYNKTWNVPGTTLLTTMPDDTVLDLKLDARTAVVALTHDPKLDDMALLEALKSDAFYVGAVGSRVNTERRRKRLADHFDLSAVQVQRLRGPVGLAIGSHTPPEISIAILAEMIAIRNGSLDCLRSN